jgi:hypothetical protein
MSLDPIYDCFLCGKKLRYSGYKKAVVEIGSDLEHICNPPHTDNTTRKLGDDVGLESMRREKEAQAEFYEGQFHSCAYFSKEKEEDVRKRHRDGMQHKGGPLTEEQKRKIGNAVSQAAQNKSRSK